MLFNFKYFKEVYFAFGFLVFVILGGTYGYVWVEGFSVFDGFYMTIITVSTVGFEEVHPLSPGGKLFTAILIILSFGTFAFVVTSITKYLVSGQYRSYFRDFHMAKKLDKVTGHVIVCGYGRNGKQAINRLNAHNTPYVIIESKSELVEEIRVLNLPVVEGDATMEENLFTAGIDRAQALITTLPKDSDNLFVVLTARDLSDELTIISRASEDSSERKLRIAGADNVIMPDKVGGDQMASLVVTPDVVDFLDHISIQGSAEINLEEIEFKDIPVSLKYKTIKYLEDKDKTGIKVIGFKTPEGEYIVNPASDLALVPNAKIFVLGTAEQIKELNTIFGVKEH